VRGCNKRVHATIEPLSTLLSFYFTNIPTNSSMKLFRVIITNHKKSGEQFKNLLAMKPIFDQHGAYRFVVSVQFEARPGNSMRLLNFANALIEMLPSVAYCMPDE